MTKTNKYPSYDEVVKVFSLVNETIIRNTTSKLVINKKNTKNGYCSIYFNKSRKMVYYHQILWILKNGDIPVNLYLDHINGNRIDNRLENLRLVTKRENNINMTIHRDGKLFGCSYDKHRKKWRVRPKMNGKPIHIGWFDSEVEAHNAYKGFVGL